MEPALKQRLIGAAVLVAIAVIFLPMLIKGPAPESGVSDISLDLPDAPRSGFETRELPLTAPAAGNGASVTGPGDAATGAATLPTVDTRTAREADGSPMEPDAPGLTPAPVAAGDYAVSFGSYATQNDAQRIIDAVKAKQLPAYQEAVSDNGRTLHRVRIGPFETRAAAEAARVRSTQVRNDDSAKVVVLDAASGAAATPKPAEKPAATTPAPAKPIQQPAAQKPAPQQPAAKPSPAPAASKPAPPPAVKPGASAPAAAKVGFVVQLGAFENQAEALALRDRSRGLGLSAFVEQVRSAEGKTLHRVQVGPVADRAAADQLKAEAARKLGIAGFVRSHP